MKTLCNIIALALLDASPLGHAADPRYSLSDAMKRAVFTPRPEYPLEARRAKLTGSCVVLMHVGADGKTTPRIGITTGSAMLDAAALNGFKRWRFKPGPPLDFRMPITFTMTGLQLIGR